MQNNILHGLRIFIDRGLFFAVYNNNDSFCNRTGNTKLFV